ncbi:low affinity high capacity ammonium permease [Emydomyces testavorans]|uniref:Ammonium transporter n=1 Tax=Emydomyces testavorans TaxID=2070801 RepID=A0AAF0DG78_9EURO|nr:low affinity high capacity ammonium permease [Emydomyces testavorans]
MSAPYAPDYASYNWTGAPSNFNLTTDKDLGGNSRVENLNKWFQSGDQAYIIIASAMVMIMVPGLAFLYSGLARRKSALSMIWACMCSMSVIFFQWYFWGYSLAFSPTATNGFIGNLRNFGLMKTLADPSPGSPLIPGLLFAFYQMQFCAVTAAIVIGAVAERGRLLPAMVFVFFWATLVYCPIACWVWNTNGWAFKYGVMDYAGGGPVEIGSGMSGLAYSLVLGRRHERMMLNFRPHNMSLIVLGTVLLWFGWLGFNGGSAFGANLRAVISCWNSNLTAAFAAMAWVLLDWRLARKWTMVGWCSGTISGLVAATPAAGFLPPWASVILGIVTGVVSNYSTNIKYWLKIDDSMDIFAEHGVAGIVGLLFNALFGDDAVVGLDGVNVGAVNPVTHTPVGGWIIHNYRQLYIQTAYILACMGYSFVVSALIAYAINFIPGLHLRVTEEAELLGMDDDQLGEFAYDYVEVRRDYLAWTPQRVQPSDQVHNVPRSDLYGFQEHSDMAARPVQNGRISPSHSMDNIPKEFPSDSRTPSGSASRQPSPERRHRLARVFGSKLAPAPPPEPSLQNPQGSAASLSTSPTFTASTSTAPSQKTSLPSAARSITTQPAPSEPAAAPSVLSAYSRAADPEDACEKNESA